MLPDLITIQPEVIQFNRQNVQTIKITNNTTNSLNNFFFCLYNVEKFSFKPEAFSLAPKQHKLIQITLKIKSTKSIAKQFAYLKSTDVNKRLTLLINNFCSPQSRTKQTQQGYSDMNTLSSRDYHELHNRALQKIITQQQKYLIDQTANVRQFNKTQNFSIGSSSKKDLYNQEMLKQFQTKNIILQRQIQDLNQLVTKKDFEIQKVNNENKFLTDQGTKLMKKINQKQTRIKQLQSLYQKIVNQNQNYAEQVNTLKQNIQQLQKNQQILSLNQKQRQSQIGQLYKNYQTRIKQLQNIVQSSERQNIAKSNQQIDKLLQQKQEEINQIKKLLNQQEVALRQYQINAMKIQNQKKTLQENKKKVDLQNKQINQINNNLRQQIFVYKSRMEQQSNSKVQQYLQIALQSYKNQNQNLKKSKSQLQKSIQSIVNTNRQTETQKIFLQTRIQTLSKQLNKLQEQLKRQIKLNQLMKEQHHFKIKQITQKNILILQKIAQQNNTKRQMQTTRLQKQINQKNIQIQLLNQQIVQINSQNDQKLKLLQKQLSKIPQLEQQNKKLQQKVKRYKKQTRKQLKSINDNAFDQLKRVHDEKKQLQKKVNRLQKALSKYEIYQNQPQNKAKTAQLHYKSQINQQQETNQKIYFNKQNELNTRSKSQYEGVSQRKVGIHNQRHQLYQTRSNSSNNVLLSADGTNLNTSTNYELYELRQFCAFVHNQYQRFQYVFNLQSELADPLDHNGRPLSNIKPLYKAIKFFKVIQNKIKQLQQKTDQSMILHKQNTFIRQKLNQLQKNVKQDNRKDISAITITNQQKPIPQEESPSFLVNRTNLTNMNVFEMIQFLKGQMKKQYNKQVQSSKFLEDKYQILKKKIYREYRTRIVELINQNSSKKDKLSNLTQLTKIQNLIQRFIQGLSNMTHKEAILNKQIKVKNNFKQQNLKLKQKINQLQHLLSQKHLGYCNRDPVKVFNCSSFINNPNFRQQEWMQGIKLSAQLLTQKAQTQRLSQQLDIVREDYNQLKQQYNQLLLKSQQKDSQIIKLKKNQLQLQKQYEKQLIKQNQILQSTKNKIGSGISKIKSKNKYEQKLRDRQRQLQTLRTEMQKKNNLLQNYKQKQKKWQQFITQSNRSQQKQKHLLTSYKRVQQNNTMIKQSNRQLRQQNNQLKQLVQKLQKQLEKKKLYIKTLKGEDQQNRITKPLRIQQSIQQIKQLEESLRNSKQQLSRLKKLKDKDIVKLQGEISTARNQALIHIRSLESVVRATIETIRKIFTSLKILIKKKGLSSLVKKNDLIVPQNLIQINAAEIYQQFQQILQALDN